MSRSNKLDALRLPRLRLKAIERLVDALTDPTRRERAMLVVLAGYVVVWTLYAVIAKASQDMQCDAAELVVWSHHLALGYSKHPPLAAWLVRAWFTIFPLRDWSYYLFAIAYATVGLWVAWRLYARFLAPDKRLVALACLTLVPYFNFHGIRFDHNAVLGPLWAATALCFIRSFDTRERGWAALAGAAAAAAMLGKYWSVFLLAGLAVAALADTRRALYFRSAAPWITIGVGALLLAPHLVWLVQHNFMLLTYAIGAHSVKTFGDTILTAGRYLFGGLGYAAAPTLIVLALTRPRGAVLADMLLPQTPERRFVAVTFWTTLSLPIFVGPLLDVDLNPIWTLPSSHSLPGDCAVAALARAQPAGGGRRDDDCRRVAAGDADRGAGDRHCHPLRRSRSGFGACQALGRPYRTGMATHQRSPAADCRWRLWYCQRHGLLFAGPSRGLSGVGAGNRALGDARGHRPRWRRHDV